MEPEEPWIPEYPGPRCYRPINKGGEALSCPHDRGCIHAGELWRDCTLHLCCTSTRQSPQAWDYSTAIPPLSEHSYQSWLSISLGQFPEVTHGLTAIAAATGLPLLPSRWGACRESQNYNESLACSRIAARLSSIWVPAPLASHWTEPPNLGPQHSCPTPI